MKVSRRDALKDLSKYLRDMYLWCDVNGEYLVTGTVSVSKGNVKTMRRVIDKVLEDDATGCGIRIPDDYDSVYSMLHANRGGNHV